jgi:hypothetical protein
VIVTRGLGLPAEGNLAVAGFGLVTLAPPPPPPPQDDPGSGSRTYVGIAGSPRRRTVDEELEAILASLLLLT